MKKAILICVTTFFLNFIISCNSFKSCKYDSCGCDPLPSLSPSSYSFTGLDADLGESYIVVYLEGDEIAGLDDLEKERSFVFNFTGVNPAFSCTLEEPGYVYEDTLQQMKVFLNSVNGLTEISDLVLVESEKGESNLYSIDEYMKLSTSSHYDYEQVFRIVSEEDNLIHQDSSYRVSVKFSNNDEEYFIDL